MATLLRFAAAPVFGAMAGLSLFFPVTDSFCGSLAPVGALHDMGLMYLLMAVAHLPPWLRLISQGLDSQTSEAKDR